MTDAPRLHQPLFSLRRFLNTSDGGAGWTWCGTMFVGTRAQIHWISKTPDFDRQVLGSKTFDQREAVTGAIWAIAWRFQSTNVVWYAEDESTMNLRWIYPEYPGSLRMLAADRCCFRRYQRSRWTTANWSKKTVNWRPETNFSAWITTFGSSLMLLKPLESQNLKTLCCFWELQHGQPLRWTIARLAPTMAWDSKRGRSFACDCYSNPSLELT